MTLQSYPSHSEEVVASGASSSSSSASTSSTDVCPLPLSIGQKEIVLSNDERALIAELPDVNLLAPGANINITDSTNVDVGNRTTFNRDVTIYQIIQGSTLPEIQNGVAGHEEVVCNKNVTLLTLENKDPKITEDYENAPGRQKSYLAVTVTILLIVAVLFLIAVLPKPDTSDSTKLTIGSASTEPPVPGSDADVFIPREKWGGIQPTKTTTIPAARLVVVKHTGGPICNDETTCRTRVREIQKEHMEVFKFPDISYNFLIGGDGKIYIGRDFRIKNEGRNDSMDIAFIGNFSISTPTNIMLQMAYRLIIKGYSPKVHAIDYVSYHVVNHNQTERTDSPGKNLFVAVTKWKNYSPKIYFSDFTTT